MAINSLDFQSKLTGELDKELVSSSVVGFFADNIMRQKFVGAKNVLIPDLELQGLAAYDRDSGFTQGSVTVDQKTYTLTQDRARTFSIDREDMDEVGVAELAGQIMGEFVRTKVVPEVDAYALSKLSGIAAGNDNSLQLGDGETIETDCVKLINTAVNNINEVTGYEEEVVVFVNPTVYKALMESPELSRHIDLAEFKKGEISTRVQKINNAVIIPVPSARMKTEFDFLTSGAGGFEPNHHSEEIGLIAMPKKAGCLVKKTEKIRIFEPDQNVNMDAYKFDYRIYYDLFVKNSAADTIYTYIY